MLVLVALAAFVVGAHFHQDAESGSQVLAAQKAAGSELRDQIVWMSLRQQGLGVDAALHRAKVPGGWLVSVRQKPYPDGAGSGITFYPDAKHQWQGVSIR